MMKKGRGENGKDLIYGRGFISCLRRKFSSVSESNRNVEKLINQSRFYPQKVFPLHLFFFL